MSEHTIVMKQCIKCNCFKNKATEFYATASDCKACRKIYNANRYALKKMLKSTDKELKHESVDRLCNKCNCKKDRNTDFSTGSSICKECKKAYDAERRSLKANFDSNLVHLVESVEKLTIKSDEQQKQMETLVDKLNKVESYIKNRNPRLWAQFLASYEK